MAIEIKNGQCVFEGMTSITALINAKIKDPQNARSVEEVYISESLSKNKYKQLAFLKAKSAELGYRILTACDQDIDNLTTGNTHGGIIAVCSEKHFPAISDLKLNDKGIYFLIEGVEDPYNFGYTLRSLYAAGVDGVILPERNWMTASGTVARSSAGCSELMDIYVCEPLQAVEYFKSNGYRILTANIRDSVSLYDTDLSAPILFIIGGEKRGVSKALLDLTDQNIRIGYGREFKGSLPTAQATAIIAFETARCNKRID